MSAIVELALTLILLLQNLPDAGAFGGLFVPEDRKKLEKEDEKRVSFPFLLFANPVHPC